MNVLIIFFYREVRVSKIINESVQNSVWYVIDIQIMLFYYYCSYLEQFVDLKFIFFEFLFYIYFGLRFGNSRVFIMIENNFCFEKQ